MTRQRVLCSAIPVRAINGGWSVRVTGLSPHAETRTYVVKDATESEAAMRAMAQFVEEMERKDAQSA